MSKKKKKTHKICRKIIKTVEKLEQNCQNYKKILSNVEKLEKNRQKYLKSLKMSKIKEKTIKNVEKSS